MLLYKAAFLGLRWVHFTVAFLFVLSEVLGNVHQSKTLNKGTSTGLNLFAKFLEVLQVVLYQGAIFFDQYTIGTADLNSYLKNSLEGATGEVKSFLIIEIYSFYMLIAGAITFLLVE